MNEVEYGQDHLFGHTGLLRLVLRRAIWLLMIAFLLMCAYRGISHISECRRLRRLQLNCVRAQPARSVIMYQEIASGLRPSIEGPHHTLELGRAHVYIREVPAWEDAVPQLLGSRFARPVHRADAFIGEVVVPSGDRFLLEIGLSCRPDARSYSHEAGVPSPGHLVHYVGARVFSVGGYLRPPALLLDSVFDIRRNGYTFSKNITIADTLASRTLLASDQGDRNLSFSAGWVDASHHNQVMVSYEIEHVRGYLTFSLELLPGRGGLDISVSVQ